MRSATSAIRVLLFVAALSSAARSALPTTRPIPAIERVLVISIDGLRPDLIYRAEAPNLQGLIRAGSFTLWAKTVPASITLPSHVSMLTGVPPEVHGVTFNDEPKDAPIGHPRVPSLFTLAHDAGYTTGMAAGKSKFAVFDSGGAIDWKWLPSKSLCDDEDVAAAATTIVREHRPQVMFTHFGMVDGVGHAKGWGGDEQIAAVARADASVGKVIQAYRDANLIDHTLIIVSADHGGAGRTHGPNDPRSRTIPWIVVGPSVKKNYDLTRLGKDHNVQTYDTFATACAVLGIAVDPNIEGRFVPQAFEGLELMAPTTKPAK